TAVEIADEIEPSHGVTPLLDRNRRACGDAAKAISLPFGLRPEIQPQRAMGRSRSPPGQLLRCDRYRGRTTKLVTVASTRLSTNARHETTIPVGRHRQLHLEDMSQKVPQPISVACWIGQAPPASLCPPPLYGS